MSKADLSELGNNLTKPINIDRVIDKAREFHGPEKFAALEQLMSREQLGEMALRFRSAAEQILRGEPTVRFGCLTFDTAAASRDLGLDTDQLIEMWGTLSAIYEGQLTEIARERGRRG
jgi:hypothetical protein